MTKKDIKIFFKAVSDGDLDKVSELVDHNSEYLTICRIAPPKKDDGQSGLQVSFKNGNFEISKLLIDKGADVNFMETSEINEWRAPVLHDCIRATIFNTYTLRKDTKQFDKAFSLLKLMLRIVSQIISLFLRLLFPPVCVAHRSRSQAMLSLRALSDEKIISPKQENYLRHDPKQKSGPKRY